MTTRLTLFWILIIAAVVRFWYISYAGGSIILEPDSQGYYSAGNFFAEDVVHNFFNPNRTPGYTMLTSLAMTVTGVGQPPYQSSAFFAGTRIIILFQTVVGLLGLIVLFDTLVALGLSRKISLFFTACTGMNIYQFSWERAFLTEALYIFIFTVLMRLFVALIKKPTPAIGIIFCAFAIFGFLLRPAGLLTPYLLLPIVVLMHPTRKTIRLVGILLCLYSVAPIGFAGMNKVLYNFKGISYNTDFSVFGRILRYDIPVDSAASVPNLYSKVMEYRAAGGNISKPWYFFVFYNNEVYGRLDELQQFNRLVIQDHFWLFAQTVIKDIPKAFSDTYVEEVLYRSSNAGFSRMFFDAITWIIQQLQQITILFLVFFPLSVWLFIKKQTPLHTFLFAIGIVEIYQLFSSLIFGGAWEYARHMITTQTYLFFFCFWWITKLWRYR